VNGWQAQALFQVSAVGLAADPAQPLAADPEGGVAREDAADRRQRRRREPAVGLLRQRVCRRPRGAPRQAGGALRPGDQLADSEQHVLVARQPAEPGPFEDHRQTVERQRRDVGADLWPLGVQRPQLGRQVVVVAAARLEVLLPAVAGDGHLEDLRGAFVDGGDAHVALDFLHHVLAGVAVAAQRLDRRLGRGVAALAGEVLGDRAFGIEAALAAVDPLGGLLDIGTRGLQPDDVRHDQLVGVALLLRQRRAGLDALGGVGNGAVETGPAAAQAEGGDHQPGVAEDRLGLLQALAFDVADQPVGRHQHLVEVDRGGIAGTDAVLVLGLAPAETLDPALDDEPARSARGEGQHAVEIGVAAVGDPLLGAGDPVAGELAVVDHRLGAGAERAEVAAGFRLGGAVGHQQPLAGDAAHPVALLFGGTAEDDRVAAQEGRQHAGGDAEVDRRQLLADAVDVEGATAHAAVLLGDEQQLDAQLVAAHGAHDLHRELVGVIQLEQPLRRQQLGRELADRFQGQLQRLTVQAVVGSCHLPSWAGARQSAPYEAVTTNTRV
jgi:hypothetical protein